MNHPLFHKINQVVMNQLPDKGAGCLVFLGVSGGADSVALLRLIREVSRCRGLEIQVLHCHHGLSADALTNQFRREAHGFVKELCKTLGVPFHSNDKEKTDRECGTSEADLRQFRYKFFSDAIHQVCPLSSKKVYLSLGHHRDDAVENSLIQLIRGVGPEGFLASNQILNSKGNECFDGAIFRPLLGASSMDITNFLKESGQTFLQDPSNSESGPLRNWIRNTWLPQLDEKRPGSIKSLGRSLSLLAQGQPDTAYHKARPEIEEACIDRAWYRGLEVSWKAQVLHSYLKNEHSKVLTQAQLGEAIKRLDSERNELTFTLAGCHWVTSRDWIKVSAPVVPYER